MPTPTLSDLHAFVAVAEHRSFRRAAEERGVSRSALSHAVKSLEKDLAVRLLHRTTRSLAPTEAGERLLVQIRPLLRDLDDVLQAAATQPGALHGRLRINAGESAARWLLRHVVPTFLARHPDVLLDLVTDGRLIDIVAAGFDAGVRLAEAVPQDMVAVPLAGDSRFIAVASPIYLAQYGRPETPDDLRHHLCIRQRLPSGRPYRWEFEREGQDLVVDPPGALTLDHNGLMVEAACDGLGIGFVPEAFAQEALADGRLEALLYDWCPAIPGLQLYYPRNRHTPSPLLAFLDVIKEMR